MALWGPVRTAGEPRDHGTRDRHAELCKPRGHRESEDVPVPRLDAEELPRVQEALRVPCPLLLPEPAGELLPEAVRHQRGLPQARAVRDPAELDPHAREPHGQGRMEHERPSLAGDGEPRPEKEDPRAI